MSLEDFNQQLTVYASVSQPFLIGGTLPFFFNNLAAPLTAFY